VEGQTASTTFEMFCSAAGNLGEQIGGDKSWKSWLAGLEA
jgi:hypothetical protein